MRNTTGPVRVKLADQEWDVDLDTLTLKDWFAIKAASGLSRVPFLNGLLEEDPLAVQTLIWFLRYRTGQVQDLASIDFNYLDFNLERLPDPPAEAAATNSEPNATATSGSSPTGATFDPATLTP